MPKQICGLFPASIETEQDVSTPNLYTKFNIVVKRVRQSFLIIRMGGPRLYRSVNEIIPH